MAKYFCGLCGNKIGLLDDYFWLNSSTILCGKCNSLHNKVLESIEDEDENAYNAHIEKVKSLYPEEKTADILAVWNDKFNEKYEQIKEKIEKEKEREKELEEEKERQRLAQERQRLEELRLEEELRQKQIKRDKENIELEKESRAKLQKENSHKIENLIQMGLDGYYEYKVINLTDNNAGSIDPNKIEFFLNDLGLNGWHLRCAYTNELGKNSNSNGFGGFSEGTNATIDQNILIFERFVRINK